MEVINILPSADSNKLSPQYLGARVRQTLVDHYPVLEPFDRYLPAQVFFGSLAELQDIERRDVCLENLPIYVGIRDLLPHDPKKTTRPHPELLSRLERAYLTVRSEGQSYCNPERGEMYFPRLLLDHILRGNSEAIRIYNYNLVENFLRILAYQVNPHVIGEDTASFARLVMMEETSEYIQRLENYMEEKGVKKGPKIEFRLAAKKLFSDFFSESGMRRDSASLIAVGGKVIYIRGDQNLVQSEASIGGRYDLGTVFTLAEPVKKALLETANLGLKPSNQVEAEKVNNILGLKEQDLIMDYMYSMLTHQYFECHDIRLNPLSYPEVAGT